MVHWLFTGSGILRDKTMDDKLMFIPIEKKQIRLEVPKVFEPMKKKKFLKTLGKCKLHSLLYDSFISDIFRDKTMDDKLMFIPNEDNQNYPFCELVWTQCRYPKFLSK